MAVAFSTPAFAVEYHGSLTDEHGEYMAVPSAEFPGRFTLTGGPGGRLINVREQSFTAIAAPAPSLVEIPRENGTYRVVTSDDDSLYIHVFTVSSWNTSWECSKDGVEYDFAASVGFPNVRLGMDDMTVGILAGYGNDSRSGEGYGFGAVVSIIRER